MTSQFPSSASLWLQKPASVCAKTHSATVVPSHSTVLWSDFRREALIKGTCATTQTPRSDQDQLYTSILFRDFTPVKRAVIITGGLSSAQLLRHVRWHTKVDGTFALACPAGRYEVHKGPNGVQVNSWQKTGRDTYVFFPFNLLVGHLHCIQIFKMQFH